MLSDQSAAAVCIYARGITDVVAVRLEPSNHRVLSAEKPGVPVGDVERPVVANFVGAADRPRIKTAPAVVVVSVPSCVGRLRQDVGVAGIVAHHKKNRTCLAGVQAHETGKIDSGSGVVGHCPGCGNGPIATVREADRAIRKARRLRLR